MKVDHPAQGFFAPSGDHHEHADHTSHQHAAEQHHPIHRTLRLRHEIAVGSHLQPPLPVAERQVVGHAHGHVAAEQAVLA